MKNVTIFTSNTCGYCQEAKRWMDQNGHAYTEKNVNTDPEARAELIKNGFMGVPVIYVDGEVVQGFDKTKLEELLG